MKKRIAAALALLLLASCIAACKGKTVGDRRVRNGRGDDTVFRSRDRNRRGCDHVFCRDRSGQRLGDSSGNRHPGRRGRPEPLPPPPKRIPKRSRRISGFPQGSLPI
ncbi:MAG: hypothetical protein L6V84_03640 [Oscillospiraceae bacterium]|nr:MAG: hypothetical protein L6V84_03640 [Oscillospiraceae bacterium]